MRIDLNVERRQALNDHLVSLFRDEFDEELFTFRADAVIDLMLDTLGAVAYNQAVEDVRESLQSKLDDLDGEFRIDGAL